MVNWNLFAAASLMACCGCNVAFPSSVDHRAMALTLALDSLCDVRADRPELPDSLGGTNGGDATSQPAETRGGLLDPLGKRMVEHGVAIVNAKIDRLAPKVARAVADTIEADAKEHPLKAADAFVQAPAVVEAFAPKPEVGKVAILQAMMEEQGRIVQELLDKVEALEADLERSKCRCCDEPKRPLKAIAEPKTNVTAPPRFAGHYPAGTHVELRADGLWHAITSPPAPSPAPTPTPSAPSATGRGLFQFQSFPLESLPREACPGGRCRLPR